MKDAYDSDISGISKAVALFYNLETLNLDFSE